MVLGRAVCISIDDIPVVDDSVPAVVCLVVDVSVICLVVGVPFFVEGDEDGVVAAVVTKCSLTQ